jgi:transporter family-2 protein
MPVSWLGFALALLAGAVSPLQAGVNAQLAKVAGSPLFASFFSFIGGTLVLYLVILILGLRWPELAKLTHTPWWYWIGGIVGALFVTSNVFLAPRLGALALVGLIIAGQIISSTLLDHFGLAGYTAHPLSIQRITGIFLLSAGVWLMYRY